MPKYFSSRLLPFLVALSMTCAVAAGCSDDDSGTNNSTQTQECAPGKTFNRVTGECEARSGDPDVGGQEDAGVEDSGGIEDAGPEDTGPTDSGPAEDVVERCDPDEDSDNDGLTNDCECELGTHPFQEDTDGDGLLDGEEDADQNCQLDPGETDPREADTDLDGLDDGDEIAEGTDPLLQDTDGDGVPDGAEVDSGCMDPLDEDTDGDGLSDGVEDSNGDGEIGTCPNRQYALDCAQGESDPCSEDTDGDGTLDSDEAQYRDCRPEDTQNLVPPAFIEDTSADLRLATQPSVDSEAATFSTGNAVAHVFGDSQHNYTGFVASLEPANSQTNPSLLADEVISKVQGVYSGAARRSSGRQITAHDGYKGVVGSVADLPAGTDLDSARDEVLAELAGVSVADMSHSLSDSYPGDANDTTLFVYEVLSRSQSQYIVVGAFVTLTDYKDDTAETGFRVDDLTGGPSLAGMSDTLVEDCVSYEVTTEPEVDVIISLDASGSMGDEQDALSGFATEFTNLLNGANVDWRVGVTGVDCAGIKDDTDLSQEYRDLWPASSFTGVCPSMIIQSGGNGKLVGGDFTTDPATISSRLDQVDTGASEFTMTMGVAAIDRALPRTDGDPAKIREDAAVVLVTVTDESDQYFKEKLDFIGGTDLTLTPSQQTTLEAETQPWVDYLLQESVGATVFGLYWPPGEQCGTGRNVAHDIAEVVNETGGNGGSVCQTDITNTLAGIADATAGIASGLRIRGTAAPQTLQVKHAVVSTGNIEEMDRSREDGFDYDAIVNRIAFRGPNPPQTNDRVVIPYLRWDNSVTGCTVDADCPQEQKQICVDGECL